MPPKIFRYKMTRQENKLWDTEDMDGWRRAFEACVEHDARDEGFKRYELLDRKGTKVAAGVVRKLVVPAETAAS
jgi:hypothetical protein